MVLGRAVGVSPLILPLSYAAGMDRSLRRASVALSLEYGHCLTLQEWIVNVSSKLRLSVTQERSGELPHPLAKNDKKAPDLNYRYFRENSPR